MTSRLRLAETRATRAILRRRDRAKRLEDSGFSGDKGKPSPSSARRAARRSGLIDGKETETDGHKQVLFDSEFQTTSSLSFFSRVLRHSFVVSFFSDKPV